MNAQFPRPVTVLVGLGVPRRLASVDAALSFLQDMPAASRDEAYDATVSACRDALAGLVSVDLAHDLVCAFARRKDMYLEDTAFCHVDPADVPALAA